MARNDLLQWLILRVGLAGPEGDLGSPTNVPHLCRCAKDFGYECNPDEVLDARYTMPREQIFLGWRFPCERASRGSGTLPQAVTGNRAQTTHDGVIAPNCGHSAKQIHTGEHPAVAVAIKRQPCCYAFTG
jgi:hypothetical protein